MSRSERIAFIVYSYLNILYCCFLRSFICLFGWLFRFMEYQPFSGDLMPNQILNISV